MATAVWARPGGAVFDPVAASAAPAVAGAALAVPLAWYSDCAPESAALALHDCKPHRNRSRIVLIINSKTNSALQVFLKSERASDFVWAIMA
jgi:hypothetical protein